MADAADGSPFTDPAYADRRFLATLYLFLIYVVLTPLGSALLTWGYFTLAVPRGGFLDLEHSLLFWLAVAFIGGAPVLLAAAVVHFLMRRKPLTLTAAAVFVTGALGWFILGEILEQEKATNAIAMGMPLLVFAFALSSWSYRRILFGNKPQQGAPA